MLLIGSIVENNRIKYCSLLNIESKDLLCCKSIY